MAAGCLDLKPSKSNLSLPQFPVSEVGENNN